ncbi:MAG: aminopeptidase [Lysinibacillus sp.]
MTFEEKLTQYAQLAVKVGVNIQPGQYLLINTSTEALPFARLVVEQAYKAGAGRVHVNLTDPFVERALFDNATEDEFGNFPKWVVAQRDELIERKGALMWIDADDPDLLAGVAPTKLSAHEKASGNALKNYRKAIMNDDIAWSIIAVPSPKWAAKIFPEVATEKQVDTLWDAIFKTVRIGDGDAVEAWRQHVTQLKERAVQLNEMKIEKLHYSAPGTDLTIELPKGHIWQTGSSLTPEGATFIANMPTEEVFTLPYKHGVNGYVSNTKPLAYRGNIIDGFKLTFENGRVIDATAEVGEELLKELLKVDEGASFLGEVALVPHHSPISESNILYFNTLFDENASNHLAIGEAYPTCYEGGRDITTEQLEELGINRSLAHEDFMIGSEQMDIDAVLASGETVAIFRNGNWAF